MEWLTTGICFNFLLAFISCICIADTFKSWGMFGQVTKVPVREKGFEKNMNHSEKLKWRTFHSLFMSVYVEIVQSRKVRN